MTSRATVAGASVAIFLLVASAHPARAIGIRPGDFAPDFTVADLDGKAVTLSGLRGKTVLIVFWSTWCARCTRELAFLRDNFGGRQDLTVLLINQDTDKEVDPARIAEMRAKLSLPFSMVLDPGLELWDRFGIQALPTSVAIGQDGRVIYAESNFSTDTPANLLKALSQK